jgi:HemY protein
MIKLIILCILGGLLIGSGISYLAIKDAGYVLFSWNGYSIETSVWVALTLLFISIVILKVILLTMHSFSSGVKAASPWGTKRKRNRARRLTTQGLLDLAEGKWERAYRRLTMVADDTETPLLNYLAAARATHELGKDKEMLELLGRAKKSTDGAELAVGLTQAQLQLGRKQFEQSLATLMRLRTKYPKHRYVLKLLVKTYGELKDWKKLNDLLPEIRKHNILESDQEFSLMQHIYLEMLSDCKTISDKNSHIKKLKSVWNEIPKQGKKHNPELISAYATQMNDLELGNLAEEVVRHYLKDRLNNKLVELYSLIKGANIGSQILFLEQQLKSRPNETSIQLALGRLSLQQENWDKAEQYFLDATDLENNTAAFAELCRFYQAKGDMSKAIEYFQKGAQAVLPKLPMPA